MEEVALQNIDSRLQKQIENARKAVDKNPTYAVDILANIVARNPACLEARQILRQAQQRLSQGKSSGLGKLFSKISGLSASIGSEAKVKKDPLKAMEAAEALLARDVGNPAGHRLLGAAAEALGLEGTAVFAYEGLVKAEPENSENAKLLMRFYIKLGKMDEAIQLGDAAYRQNPADEELQNLVKKASVEKSINKGKWEEDNSFRDKLKDEDQAQKLEQAGRAKTGESGLRALIEGALEAVAAEPENINHYRDLVSTYRKLDELDHALLWLQNARQLDSGRADVNLERLEATLKREIMAQSIATKETELEADPANASLLAELQGLRIEERRVHLAQAEDMVQRYPNEFSYRYELGHLYYAEGEIDKTIKELQLAQRSPKVRIDALVLLGKAYKEKGFSDLAAEQFTTVKNEIPGMSDQKKDVIYELGSAYEQQGEMDKAMAEFKALYGADISYRDVAEKIDAFYAKKNS
ncbi:MAG: tetratricopeptide (TPR) repeat protein [Lentimonas sp.]|jgi:tetratricopeptide (TPR) repeat protein